MEALRVKLREPEGEIITIDIWGERNTEGRLEIVKHLTFYGEWLDDEGETYPFALRYDGVLDYGAWSEDAAKGSHLLLHGKELHAGVTFPYESKFYKCEFSLIACQTVNGWRDF